MRTGVVVSDKMQKTVVVQIDRRMPHPVYGKMVTRTEAPEGARRGELGEGRATPCVSWRPGPLSKDKRWRVVEIVERAR